MGSMYKSNEFLLVQPAQEIITFAILKLSLDPVTTAEVPALSLVHAGKCCASTEIPPTRLSDIPEIVNRCEYNRQYEQWVCESF